MILSHVSCFIQAEVGGFQVLLDSLYPRSTRASWWACEMDNQATTPVSPSTAFIPVRPHCVHARWNRCHENLNSFPLDNWRRRPLGLCVVWHKGHRVKCTCVIVTFKDRVFSSQYVCRRYMTDHYVPVSTSALCQRSSTCRAALLAQPLRPSVVVCWCSGTHCQTYETLNLARTLSDNNWLKTFFILTTSALSALLQCTLYTSTFDWDFIQLFENRYIAVELVREVIMWHVYQVHNLAQQQGLIVLNKTTTTAGPSADQTALVHQLRLQQLFQQQQQQHGALAGATTVQVRPTSITLPTTTQYTQQHQQQQVIDLVNTLPVQVYQLHCQQRHSTPSSTSSNNR